MDGDTIALPDNTRLRARFIDCAECLHHSPDASDNQFLWGANAKNFLSRILHKKQLGVIPFGEDKHGRTLADWYVIPNGKPKEMAKNIQSQIVLAGLAHCSYLPHRPELLLPFETRLIAKLLESQAKAQEKKAGFWNDKDFIFPAQWRQLH